MRSPGRRRHSTPRPDVGICAIVPVYRGDVDVAELESGVLERFGSYDLLAELAAGGMATVFLGRRRHVKVVGLDRFVAIKRIHPHLSKMKDFVEMFLDEARITSYINHPNVCTIHDFGEIDGQYFIAMEYVFGETFAEVRSAVRDNRTLGDELWAARVARMIANCAEGLHAAHELCGEDGQPLKVVHRDVSPQNLFLAYDGSVRVMDFGIAHAEGRYHQTRTGTVKGKFAYMSPEQYVSGHVDRRADIWALGVVAWEMLTGKRLFRRQTDPQTMKMVESLEVQPPSTVSPWPIPEELDAIVLAALQRKVDDRTTTARELSRSLSRYLATHGEPMGMPEMADWSEEVFGGRILKRKSMLQSESGLRLGAPTLVTPSRSEMQTRARKDDDSPHVEESTLALNEADLEPAIQQNVGTAPPPPPQRSRQRTIVGLGAIAVLGLGVGIGVGFSDDSSANVALPTLAQASLPASETTSETRSEQAPETTSETMAISSAQEGRTTADFDSRAIEREPDLANVAATPMMSIDRTEHRVHITCEGCWAILYENGRPLGRVPAAIMLRAGSHRIVARIWNRPDQEQQITVRVPERRRVMLRPIR